MSDPCLPAEGALERLAHHDVLDIPDTHSRRGLEDGRATVWFFKNGLAARRLRNFQAIHHETLSALLLRLRASQGRRAQALRGRLRRLLGDAQGARRELEGASRGRPCARAEGWLGEMSIFDDPRGALLHLERACALDEKWPWPRLWKAAAFMTMKRMTAARRELDIFSKKEASRPFVFTLLCFQLRMMEKDYRGACEEALKAVKRDPGSPAGYDAAGKALSGLKRRVEALKRFHDARERDLDVAGTYVFEGINLDLTWETPKLYLDQLNTAIAKRPAMAVLYAERAELKRDPRLCLYAEALEDYASAARLEPRRGWLRAVLARAKNNLSGGAAGLEDFNAATRLAPACGWIRSWRGALLARLGRADQALADFEAAARLMPWYPFTYSWRGALLNRQGKFAQARKDLDLAIRLDPQYPFSFYERFRALRGLGHYEEAVDDLNRSFAADPKYTWFGPALKDEKERKSLLRELSGAAERRPEAAWLQAWRGFCLLETGSAQEALACLERALSLEKKSGLIYAWRGRAWRDLGRLERASADLRRAVRLSPELCAAHQIFSQVQEARGELAAALSSLSRATSLAPTTVPYLLAKARLALCLNRREEAAADLDRVLQLDPSCGQARLLKARLYLIRGMARQKTGNHAGQISDFRRALELGPELFSQAERRIVSQLVRSQNA